GTVLLSVHREFRGSDLGRRLRAFLEGIADDDRYLIAHVLGRPGRNEQEGRGARAAGRIGRRRLGLRKRKTHLLAARGRRVGAPVAIGPQQRRLIPLRAGPLRQGGESERDRRPQQSLGQHWPPPWSFTTPR